MKQLISYSKMLKTASKNSNFLKSYAHLLIVTPIVGVCNCSMFCCRFLYVYSSIAIILMGKRELIALLNLSSWCLVMVERLFLAVQRRCLQNVIVVFPDHTHLLFILENKKYILSNNAPFYGVIRGFKNVV